MYTIDKLLYLLDQKDKTSDSLVRMSIKFRDHSMRYMYKSWLSDGYIFRLQIKHIISIQISPTITGNITDYLP